MVQILCIHVYDYSPAHMVTPYADTKYLKDIQL